MRGEGVWVVLCDDHDYDCMSQWIVGVYLSESDADQAAERDEDRYVSRGGRRDRHNKTIEFREIGKDFVNE